MPKIDLTGKADIQVEATVTKWNDNSFQQQAEQYPPFQEVQNDQSVENLQSLNETINNNTDSFKGNTAILKEFGDVLPELVKNFRYMNSVVAQTTNNLPAVGKIKTSEEQKKIRKEDLERQGLLSIFNSGANTVQSLANGNVSGAGLGVINAGTNLLNNSSSLAKNAEMTDLASSLLKMGVITSIAGLVFKGADTLSEKFIEEMPSIYGTGRAFGTLDNADSLISWQLLNEYNKGTNLDIDTFQNIGQSLRKQGIGNNLMEFDANGNITNESRKKIISLVGNVAETTSQWAYHTGGDANQYAQLAGLMARYGGSKNVAEDFNYLVAAGKASGLNDTQIPEFLSGIQKVMEDGIAKGFSRSSTEVANTLLMFSKMSGGNAFWQGEQGARLLNQANAGIAASTSLSKTEDILVYQAIKNAYAGTIKDKNGNEISKIKAALGDTFLEDGSYVNTMQLIEQGIKPENFDDIMNSLNSSYGDNTEAKIEALRNMTGLNYTGAARLYNLDLSKLKDNELKDEIEKITKDPSNLTKETQYQEAMNSIKAAVVAIGDKTAALKIDGLDGIAKGVDNIATFLLGTTEEKEQAKEMAEKLKTLTPEQKAELYEIMPTFASTEEKQKWTSWYAEGQAGMPEGVNKSTVFSDYSTGKLKSKISWKEGSTWNDIQQLKNFTNQEYGDEILGMVGGDIEEKNRIVEELVKGDWGKSYRAKTVKDTEDKKITSSESTQTINLIKEIVKILQQPTVITQNVP